jgi:hypothetical protein
LNHILACLHEFCGIDRLAIDANFVMQVRTGAATRTAELRDWRVQSYFLALGD